MDTGTYHIYMKGYGMCKDLDSACWLRWHSRNLGDEDGTEVPKFLEDMLSWILVHRFKRNHDVWRMSSRPYDDQTDTTDGNVVTETRVKTKKPSMYKVLMLNDDYTPMEFVVYVLERFFGKGSDEATKIMLNVHQKGVGVCGVYSYEVAETKVTQVMGFARENEHPLQCTLEKD